jgi:hypothetical protein
MLLDFTNPVLDPRITFSRGTNATLVDSTGKITYAPANLVLWSQDFSNAAWAATTATKTSGVLDPLGGTTASTITATAGNGQILQSVSGSAGTSQAYVSSIWLRRRTGTGSVFLFNPNGAGITAVSLTTSWAQYSVVGFGAAATNFAGIRLATSGDEVDVAFAQFEPVTYQTTPGPYVATTASAYYGPRFDYDPVTLAPRGLLIEEARTNLLTYSAQIDDASWQKIRSSAIANSTNAPDGTVSADTLVEDTTASTTHQINKVFTGTAVAHTYSVYVKAAGRTQIRLNLFDGAAFVSQTYFDLTSGTVLSGTGGTITAVGNGWYRCAITATLAASAGCQAQLRLASGGSDIYTGGGTSGVFIWGAQLEAGAFATSYIPTVASTVSRSADVATMTGTNFSTWYNQSEGTFVVNLTPIGMPVGASNTRYLEANDGTANNRKPLLFAAPAGTSSAQYRVAGTDQAVLISSAGAYAVGINLRVATAYAVNDFAASYNGATALTDASGSVSFTATQLTIGYATSGAGSEMFNGHIRAIAYYNTRLPNTQLQTLTAPSLASPLALDFISPTYTVGY